MTAMAAIITATTATPTITVESMLATEALPLSVSVSVFVLEPAGPTVKYVVSSEL